MKPIEAKNQVRLGVARCLQLALTGMSFRMFRSGITVAILALAVAFLVHMLAYGLIARQTQANAWDELAGSRALGELISRIGESDSRSTIIAGLAGDDSARQNEYARWGGLGAEEASEVRASARRLTSAAQDLDDLPVTQKSVLLGDTDARTRLEQLAEEDDYQLFLRHLSDVGIPPPLGDEAAFRKLIQEDRPRLQAVATRVQAGHAAAIRQVAERYPGQTPRSLAADPPADFASTLAAAGFAFDAANVDALRSVTRYGDDLNTIAQMVVRPDVRAAISRRTDIPVKDVSLDTTLAEVDGDDSAAWLSGVVIGSDSNMTHLTPERVLEISRRYEREKRLQAATTTFVPADTGGLFGLSVRSQWLIMLSFIVCVVGVANAMLMSVTERFTEIATMKCLGAMDRFVMMMFVFEAVIQGVFGGLMGMVLGVVLAILRAFVEFGSLIFEAGSAVGDVVWATLLSLLVGVILAAVAAVGPSFIAARLAPMEAMRVE